MSSTAQSPAGRRIAELLDGNSFVEIGGQVTARSTDFNLQEMNTPSDGVITGYGVIDGNLVYVYSQDVSVLNGTLGEMHAKKIVRLYEMAGRMGAPVIGLIDCAGIRLQEGVDALNAFGEIYLQQTLASGVVPQITAVFGSCGGGLSVVPGLSDFTFMEEKDAKLFVNAPNTVAGNRKEKCDSASAKFQAEEAGTVDMVGSESDILAQIRRLVTWLPANNEDDASYDECMDDLNRSCAELQGVQYSAPFILSTISDGKEFFETKADYARDMVTGFIRLNGVTVGAVANGEQEMSARGAQKAADFVNFCDAFNIPVLTVTNVKGYKASLCSERNLAKAAARLTYAFANATVPKVNVIAGEAFGSAYVTMNSKGLGADLVFAWKDAKIGMMDARMAAKVMYADADAQTQSEKAKEYAALQDSVEAAARRGYVDAVIDAADTRKQVIGAFEMLFTKREGRPDKKHGTV
ncbi:MAG TPA: carboxyl transferase [Candidatus Eisenbergiella stercorigallinarum]|uniref:Carboxyl transferase n=1 Tax=Candidatus Eisenbergiella stercorigallinarum TaxID=2838557 RepID=A0A9D2QZ95_9FIRM|nr:carboxyl transferase [Candidatus Eisenbergiella stercorigallinarum]